MRKAAFAAIPLLLAAGSVLGQTTSFVCTYPTWTDSEGLHQTSGAFVLTFLFDDETSKAYMVGNQGSTEVILTGADSEKLSFIEVTATGNVMTTTIDGSGISVHSRHAVIVGDLVASQYHGTCEIRE